MTDGVDMIKVVNDLSKRPKARSCIVLTHEFSKQKDWAQKLAVITSVSHIDLLDLFAADKSLANNLTSYSPQALFKFLKTKNESETLIVSGMEFIKSSWSGNPNATDQFISQMETWNQKPALLFVIQHDQQLANIKSNRYPQYDFVIDQKDTFELTE